jgi:hypothetical protein
MFCPHQGNMLPHVQKFIFVEKIRDGGSFATKFESDDGDSYILFTKIQLVDCGPEQKDERGIRQEKELVGFQQPVLFDCDPAKRPQNTKTVTYDELSGPKSSVTWDEARQIMGEVAKLAHNLSPIRAEWLKQMKAIVAEDGCPPPGIETRSSWTRR